MAAETTPAPEAPAPEKREIPTLTYAGPTMPEAVAELEQKKELYRGMGGPDKVARQHSLGKLTVRERVERLFDAGTFTETALLGHQQSQSPQLQGKFTPADRVVTGSGRIDGRRVGLVAYDVTAMA